MELRILTWLFPWLMSVLEFLLRASAGQPDAWEFIGPTVGAAALGMMLPLTQTRVAERGNISMRSRPSKVGLVERKDHWGPRINVLVWVGLTAWATSVYLSLNHGTAYAPEIDGARTALLIGFILWLSAVLVDLARGGKQ
nr:hypothetical protein [uncultured Duganella sp.]